MDPMVHLEIIRESHGISRFSTDLEVFVQNRSRAIYCFQTLITLVWGNIFLCGFQQEKVATKLQKG